jgi:hypothetical protein
MNVEYDGTTFRLYDDQRPPQELVLTVSPGVVDALHIEANNGETYYQDEVAIYMDIHQDDAPDVLTALQDWIGQL